MGIHLLQMNIILLLFIIKMETIRAFKKHVYKTILPSNNKEIVFSLSVYLFKVVDQRNRLV